MKYSACAAKENEDGHKGQLFESPSCQMLLQKASETIHDYQIQMRIFLFIVFEP